MTTITNGLNAYTANTVAATPSSGATGAVQATTTAKASPTISLSNSATVSLSGAVVVATNTPVKFAAAIAAFKAATTPEAVAALPIYTIKDASTLLTSSPDARETLMAMAVAGKITSIAFTDTTAPKFTFDRAAISGPLDGKDNPSPAVMVLQKITTKYSLAITGISASDAGTVKPPVANAALSFSVSDNVGGISANLATLQTLAKAKALTAINIATDPISSSKPVITLTAAELKSAPDALKLLKGNIDLTITGVAAADASKTAGAADVILKAAGSTSLSKVAISDTAANISKGIASLELVAAGGRLNSITVNGNEALSLTGAQVKASENVLNVGFTGTPTKVDLKDVLTADMASMETLIEDNQSLIVNKLSIKDTTANIQAKLNELEMAFKAGTSIPASGAFMLGSILASDKGTITLSYADMQSNLDAIKAISGTYKLVVTEISVADALTLKAPATGVTLSLSVQDTSAIIASNLDKLEILAKAKSLGTVSISDIYGPPRAPVLSLSTKQFIAAPTAIKALQLPYQINLTNALATDILKLSSTPNVSTIQITDTAANIVKNLTALEAAAKAGKIASVSVSDGKSLDMTQTQIKASETFLNVTFTGNAVVEAKEVSAAEFATLEGSIEDNQSLVLGKQSIKDTAANIQAKLDQLDAAVEAGLAPSASGAFMLGNIAVSDKGTITVTNSTFLKDLDALKVVSGAYKLNVTDINVTDALAIKAPSKDATLSLTIKDTASNIAANWDKLQALVKAKTLTNITLTDGSSSLLTMTAAQLKANADVLKVVTGDYKLSVTGVAAADVAKTLTTKNIYSVEVKDTVANILKNLPGIKTAVIAAKIQSVIITDATNPTLSIADIFTLTTTLPNVTLAAGVKFNVKDTASNVVAHARYDIADVIKNAGSIALSDKTPPNLTLADATTLKGLTGLAAGTKYTVADGGALIDAQATLSGEKVLADAASVVVNKNFTINEAKAVSAIKSLAKGSAYSINDTADKILAQSALAGEMILGKANAVNVVDTSANILAKLDQLQVLAKAGKIADIKFTDTPSGPLPLTDAQMLNNAEAIGKIISQRTLPTVVITKPVEPIPINSDKMSYLTFDNNKYLNGIDDNLPLGNNSRSIEVKIKINKLAPYVQPIAMYGSGYNNNYFGISLNPTGELYFFGRNNDANGIININDNKWHNIAVTFDGSKIRLYVDGNIDSELNSGNTGVSSSYNNLNTQLGSLSIGSEMPLSNASLYADIGSVSIWSKCLAQNEISIGNTNLTGNEANLVSLYKLNSSQIKENKIYDIVNPNTYLNVFGFNDASI